MIPYRQACVKRSNRSRAETIATPSTILMSAVLKPTGAKVKSAEFFHSGW